MHSSKTIPIVVGYCRVSTTNQEDNTSLQNQKESIEAYSKSQRWNIYKMFFDIATGKNFNRPQFQEMEKQIEGIDGILVYKIDRFSRSLIDGYPKLLEYEKRGIFFRSVVESFIDTSSAMGRCMLRSIFNFCQTEREMIAERMLQGKVCNANAGKFNGGRSAFGYRYTPNSENDFEIVPEEAQIVKKLFLNYIL